GDQDACCIFQTFGAQDRRGGDIGIRVETYFLLLDCRGDFRQGFGGTAEIAHPGRLVVRDDDRHLRRLADMKALIEAVEHMLGLVTHMRRVDGGGRLMPQLPVMTVVTPWLALAAISEARSARSSCVWTSIKPGAMTSPDASISRAPLLFATLPTAAMRSPVTATSACRRGPPV